MRWIGCVRQRTTPVPRRYLPTHTVGEGFHALPAWDEGRPRFARTKGARAAPLRQMQQLEVNKPPVRGGVLDAPPSDDGRRRFRAETFPTRLVGEGFHALPAWDDWKRRCARIKWCAGCARDIAYVGRWTRGWRDVVVAGTIGRAKRLHPTSPGSRATAGRRGHRPLRPPAKRTFQHET